jgi:release factor glutamine methyltransferase
VTAAGATIASARRAAAERLAAAGLADASLDARLLLMSICGVDPAHPGSAAQRPLSEDETERFEELVVRRLAREPIARILGTAEFHGLPLAVNADCLIPRSDTEALVEVALDLLPAGEPRRILDLGTGPGTILLALLTERPQATGLGIDLSGQAVAAAEANAANLGLGPRARFQTGSWAEGITETFDLVVSNPPYIPSATCEALEPEVALHDPRRALDGGPDGLDAYRAILAEAPRLLRQAGQVALEIGIGQAPDVTAIARHHGLRLAALRSDLGAVPRALVFTAA